MDTRRDSDYRLETRLVHEGQERTPFGETSEALFITQGFIYETAESAERRFLNEEPGYSYSRYSNPTVDMFEQRMASLEGAETARATASGMAAVTAAMVSQVQAGDHVVAARGLFGSCRWVVEDFLPRFGVACTLVDGPDVEAWRKAVRPDTKAFLLETPSNPSLQIIDIAAVARIAHEAGATLTVDNVFATPLYQKPLALGADCVVYSATKHIDGQGRCLGGVILGSTAFIESKVQQFLRMTGPSISPFNAWVLLKGLETLSLRVERQTANAAFLADALHDHSKLQGLTYPGRADHPQAELIRRQMSGASTMIALDVRDGKDGAFRFMNGLQLIRISNNLGDAKSLVTHPATTTHQRFAPELRAEMGISDGLVRLSVGLEHRDDLLSDLRNALDNV
ncbi:O-succinylhomoserine sulfhydrylase [Microvirga sp. M2]|uniref:O-succinylhomoserine sulfhydrylase n=1 Tax=Microvirga sp. M2 TaxID=3073270 RepID=UPI0039C45FCE